MRTKHFILILCCVVLTTIIFIILGPAGEPNDSFKSIVTHTHQQLNILQENLRVAEQKKLEIDPKYLALLGFTNSIPTSESQYNKYTIVNEKSQQQLQNHDKLKQIIKQNNNKNGIDIIEFQHLPLQSQTQISLKDKQQGKLRQKSQIKNDNDNNINNNNNDINNNNINVIQRVTTTPFNGTKSNFSIVTYVQDGQAPSAILLAQNVAAKFPNEYLLIYDLGLSEDESRALNSYCNSSKCSIIGYDLSVYPSHVANQRMHAYRPIVIKDALMRSKSILFTENYMRIRGTSRDLDELKNKVMVSGVLGWNTSIAVSTRTHPKMFDYFQTDADDFIFLRMVDLDTVLFTDSLFVTEKIMLPWIKCALTVECIDPIGAQSNGCKYNKKPQYRYSGCHSYDISAFNIVLGLTWHLDDSKYSLPSETYNIFFKETLEQSTKILENRRRNNSDTSEHPFTEEQN